MKLNNCKKLNYHDFGSTIGLDITHDDFKEIDVKAKCRTCGYIIKGTLQWKNPKARK